MSERASPQPSRIGPYKILDCLGEGGMGIVYLAEQEGLGKRKVAVKVIKLGMDSRAFVARFEQERQALALMQHDGIAKVYDCGTTESGQPYFAMEYVPGIPLVDYCDRKRLSIRDRIQLLIQVCSAVQHAHQKGVVHRDLKPGNVLVCDQGIAPQAKVIDFGLAKAMGQKLGEHSMLTEKGIIVGTIEYMSPEQADATVLDVDTRADVYSLGVMIYETLTGQLPFSRQELLAAGEMEMRRMMAEVDPPRPSSRLSGLRDSMAAIATQRQTNAGTLIRALRDDLDWLVLKALEKDRNRRYATVNAVAMDLQRYLDDEPLQAGPPSAAYRLKKLARRYRVQLATAVLVLATALVGAGVAISFALEADAQKLQANDNEKRAIAQERIANERAKSEAEARQVAAQLAIEKGRTVEQFQQLSSVVRLKDAMEAQESLWLSRDAVATWPGKVADLQAWLDGPCAQLLAKRPSIESTIAALRLRAQPPTPSQVEADRRSSPAFAEWERQRRLVASLRRAQALRTGSAQWVASPLPDHLANADAKTLDEYARCRVVPDARMHGADAADVLEEGQALAAALQAVARSQGGGEEAACLRTLAWALVANGKDREALQRLDDAVAKAPAHERDEYERHRREIAASVERPAERLQDAESLLESLERTVRERRTWNFVADTDGESAQFLHDVLVDQLRALDALEQQHKADVALRLSWARQVGPASAAHPGARASWAVVREAIRKADGATASALYAGKEIAIPDEGWVGLVPIGMNPVTKLWEFYDLRSAWDGKQAAAEIAIPSHREDGSVEVTAATGMVFVLLPGGRVTLGTQAVDPAAPFFDAGRGEDETLHDVILAPFLLARHELTQSQWQRLWTWSDEDRNPSTHKSGLVIEGKVIGGANPVEQVSWSMCDQLLERHGMTLPTEAQWEYGCRAGTTTPWHSEFGGLHKVSNLADEAARRVAPEWGSFEAWDDGFVRHAPVGSFSPNAFGLHDMHGNVMEWCQDWIGAFRGARDGDGLRRVEGLAENKSARGGSSGYSARAARSGFRDEYAPSNRSDDRGVRAARSLPRSGGR